VLGIALDDALGRLFRNLCAAMVLGGSLFAMTGRIGRADSVPAWAIELYPPVMCALIAGYGFTLGHRASLASASLILFAKLTAVLCWCYGCLRQVVVGIDYIALGMALFSVAVLTSMVKGGLLPGRIAGGRGKLPEAPD
jgi:hypothetical protein